MIELPALEVEQAQALANLCRRLVWLDVLPHADDEEEATHMQAALCAIQKTLDAHPAIEPGYLQGIGRP